MINYWYSPKIVQQFIHLVTPKSDTFTCTATKQYDGTWTFTKGLIKDEPFCGGTDWVISHLYCDKTYSIAEDGDQVKVTVTTNKPDDYDTCFSDPVPCTDGHFYKCSYTKATPFLCDVKSVFFKGVPDKFYITVEPIAN